MRTSQIGALAAFALSAASCSAPTAAADAALEFAYLERGAGVVKVDAAGAATAPGTETADTFAWCHDGNGFIITRGGAMERVTADGVRSTLLSGYVALRFPDVRSSDGWIIVAATQTSTTEGPWHVLLLPAGGGTPLDLGPGYDPCFVGAGSAVVFEDYDVDGTALYLMGLDTKQRQRLVDGYTPSVSTDGRTLYYSSAGQLWSLPLDERTAAPTALTPSGCYDRFVSASGGGSRLLFFRQAEDATLLVERSLRTGEERHLVTGRVDLPIYRPAQQRGER